MRSTPIYMIVLTDLVLRSIAKAMRELGIRCESKAFLGLHDAENSTILYGSVSKMNKLLELLRVQCARIGLLILRLCL